MIVIVLVLFIVLIFYINSLNNNEYFSERILGESYDSFDANKIITIL